MHEFSEDDIKSAVAPFVKDGKVLLSYLGATFKALNLDYTHEDIKDTLKSNHFHAEDELTVSNFQSLVSRVANARLREKALLEEFKKFDQNGDGHISRSEAKAALVSEGFHLDEADFDEFMKDTDLDGDGNICYEEFARFASAH